MPFFGLFFIFFSFEPMRNWKRVTLFISIKSVCFCDICLEYWMIYKVQYTHTTLKKTHLLFNFSVSSCCFFVIKFNFKVKCFHSKKSHFYVFFCLSFFFRFFHRNRIFLLVVSFTYIIKKIGFANYSKLMQRIEDQHVFTAHFLLLLKKNIF